ncbi:hypothetical protein B0O99DRAFT_604827 [Bisporella sp. PMI_857]|nr:hypothetical protein B0O99DRAFT_604827 [Bisporella sp. PMI_857]
MAKKGGQGPKPDSKPKPDNQKPDTTKKTTPATNGGKKGKRNTLSSRCSKCSDTTIEARDFKETVRSGSSEVGHLHRRAPFDFSNGLPDAGTTRARVQTRINAITRKGSGAQEITQSPEFANSIIHPTNRDGLYATISGGLGGCTVLVAYNQDNIYIAHLWEVPGFSAAPPHPKEMFATQVLGFLRGTGEGVGQPLTTDLFRNKGTKATFFTVGKNDNTLSPNYPSKISQLHGVVTGDLGGQADTVLYKRPGDQQDPVTVTIEYSSSTRHLRVLLSEYSTRGAKGGKVGLDIKIPGGAAPAAGPATQPESAGGV